jgi:large subunit ribosomal protein L20
MPRTRSVPYARKRRKKWLKAAKGFWGGKHKLYKQARLAVMRSMISKFKERKRKKRVFRSLWITRINAALHLEGMKYSQFINVLKKNKIELDRRTLAQIAYDFPDDFAALVKVCKG